MKRTFIVAVFGGVLASGFLTVSTAVAHADQCSDVYGPGGKFPNDLEYQQCEGLQNGSIDPHKTPLCAKVTCNPDECVGTMACVGGPQPSQAPIGGPMCDEASKHTGIKCPGQ